MSGVDEVPSAAAPRRRSRDNRDALALVDADTRFLMATGAMTRLLGVPREQLLGVTAAQVTGLSRPPDAPAAEGGVLQRFVTAGGRVVWEELRATRLAGAVPARTVLEVRDVSERYGLQPEDDPGLGIPQVVVGTHELLLERIDRALAGRLLTGSLCVLLFVDLDRFGRLNESMGHLVGDHVLSEVGRRLSHCVRAHDTVVRWGGDEFVVLVESLRTSRESPLLADRVVRVLSEPVVHGGHRFELGASVGVAVAESDDAVSAVGLLVRADAAMYRAKTEGGCRWSMFDNELRRLGARREHLETLLDGAVPEGRVELHYQPIVEVSSGRVVGAEALMRLRDEDRSLVAPLEFLAFAEESGAIVPLEQEVMLQACLACSSWLAQGHDLSIAVNLSARQLSHMDDLEDLLGGVLEDTGLPPDRLTCEVTEHGLTDTGRATREGIARLVGAGLHFSVDDFGTGYNSLTYLRLLPVQEIKVDQSFLAGAVADPFSRAIVTAIAALARDVGIRCVAEGIERPEQHELLLELGVPYAQGFLYGRPVPYEQFTAAL